MKIQMHQMLLAGLVLAALGCTQPMNVASQSSTMSAAACVAGKAINADQLSIQGQAGAAPGDVVRYSLSQDPGCVPGQTVSWKTLNGAAAGDAAVFSATFRKPGSYVVAAQILSSASPLPTEVSYKTVVAADVGLSGPQVGMAYVENTFALTVPSGVTIASTTWTFGDQSAPATSLSSVKHAYPDVGTYTVTVNLKLSGGQTQTLTHQIQIIPVREGYECSNQLALSGATSVGVGVPAALAVYIPSCLTSKVVKLAWTFGDGGTAADQSVQHTYQTVGLYPVTVGLYAAGQTQPFAVLNTVVSVTNTDANVDPVDDANNQCATVGLTREVMSDLYTKELACGVQGKRVNTYKDVIAQRCDKPAQYRVWVEVGRTQQLVNQGDCVSQACELPAEALTGVTASTLGLLSLNGKTYLADGASKIFYTNTLPGGACADGATTRACANGVLGGSTDAKYLLCQSGCAGIGPSGTALLNQVIGQESAAKTCAFGETGILDQYAQLATKTCQNGAVVTSDVHRGDLTLAGVCPSYSMHQTDAYGACSADCGGTQNAIFECRDGAGIVAPAARCAGQETPVVTQICDGNPDAVKRSDVAVGDEEGGQSKTCPSNQIGIIVLSRTKTTTSNYACVNHQVQMSAQTVAYGAWTSQNFCRDYVAYRCSQDSLSNDDSVGRLKWMLKCQDQVPVIKDFLTQFQSYRAGTDDQPYLSYNKHKVYATFMNRATSPEKVWKAPTKESGTCDVPATAYIAAVCTASCATPEQQILADAKAQRQLAYAPIGTAWAEQFKAVATLAGDSLGGRKVTPTRVDQWVTELVDGTHEILDFHLKSGGVLRLTPNHPVVTDQGTIKLAADFVAGENLMRLGGERDPIVSIERTVHEGKVYNLFVKNSDPQRNVVVTNGYLNGTAFFQNEGSSYVNTHLFRMNLVRGAIK